MTPLEVMKVHLRGGGASRGALRQKNRSFAWDLNYLGREGGHCLFTHDLTG
jgi:hypothetical protein